MARRQLIVNADDLGQDRGINAGVLAAAALGIVSSASLMVRWPTAATAAAGAEEAGLSVGLHLDFGEWTCENDEWRLLYEVVDTDDLAAVEHQIELQIDQFRQLTGHSPTHLDSHQHVHRSEPVRGLVAAAAADLGVPLRDVTTDVTYLGGFYGQSASGEPYPEGITPQRLIELLAALPAGTTELGCHPGIDVTFPTMYRQERDRELAALCDPEVKSSLDALGIELISFADLR